MNEGASHAILTWAHQLGRTMKVKTTNVTMISHHPSLKEGECRSAWEEATSVTRLKRFFVMGRLFLYTLSYLSKQ